MIYNHIIAHPGVSFNILKTVFNLKDGTLRYHLDYLKRADKINFGLTKGKRKYYPNSGSTKFLKIENDIFETNNLTPPQGHILNTIKEHPGINQKELVKKTGYNRFKLERNLKKLLELCVVRKMPDSKNIRYEFITNDQLQYEMLMSLVTKFLKREIDENKFLELKRKLEK